MLNALPFSIAVGAVLGFLTGLGTGGGSLLVLWLTLVANLQPEQARAINLMFFIPAALCATVVRCRRGGIPWQKIWLPTVVGSIAAAIFAGFPIDSNWMRKAFGILLILIGVRELWYRSANHG